MRIKVKLQKVSIIKMMSKNIIIMQIGRYLIFSKQISHYYTNKDGKHLTITINLLNMITLFKKV